MNTKWPCPRCNRIRSTKFCPDCGIERVISDHGPQRNIELLRALFIHCRNTQHRHYNSMQTWDSNGEVLLAEQWRQSAKKWQEYGDALELAIETISQK